MGDTTIWIPAHDLAAAAIAGRARIEQAADGGAVPAGGTILETALRLRPVVPDPRWRDELHAVMPIAVTGDGRGAT